MPSPKPHHRLLAVKAAVRRQRPLAEDDTSVRALFDRITTGRTTNAAVTRAAEIYESAYQRQVMQAWIVARATDAEIEKTLRIPPLVSEVYRHLFFDLAVFRDELELLDWVQSYDGDMLGRTLLQQAIVSGVPGLQWQFGRAGDLKLDPKAVVNQAMVDAHFRSRAGRLSGVASKEAVAAHGYSKTALMAASTLKENETNLLQELLIKLQHADRTTPITAEERPDDILH